MSAEYGDLAQLRESLRLDRAGNWDDAHRIVQRLDSVEAYRIHAYLHREEGDLNNAAYWYRRAGIPMYEGPLAEEWEMLSERAGKADPSPAPE